MQSLEGKKIIVSLTSYPERTKYLDDVICSLVTQSVPANQIILYLAIEQYSEAEKEEILFLQQKYFQNNFIVKWVENDIKSHKKYFYSFQEYPHDIIITVDDDIIYNNDLIEKLLDGYKKFPDCIICGRANLITMCQNGEISPYTEWYKGCTLFCNIPMDSLMATGCGGVLYSPELFDIQLYDYEIIQMCIFEDDIWLKVNEIKNNIKTVLVDSRFEMCDISRGTKKGLYNTQNYGNKNSEVLIELLNSMEIPIAKLLEDKFMMTQEAKRIQFEKGVKELNDKLSNNNNFVIYGCGYMARKIYTFLENNGISKYVQAFLVSDEKNNPSELFGIKVLYFKKYKINKSKVIIALRDSEQKKNVYNQLLDLGYSSDNIIILSVNSESYLDSVDDWHGSQDYWENRYRFGGNSGSGSYNNLREWKAEIINNFCVENNIQSVIEWGCGDGNQLELAEYKKYIGLDVSKTAVDICKKKFKNDKDKEFIYSGEQGFSFGIQADLVLSLDVIYHLVEDDIYMNYMDNLLKSAKKFICIYSSNYDERKTNHVRCRKFTDYFVDKTEWELVKFVKNIYPFDENKKMSTSWSDFYFYRRK